MDVGSSWPGNMDNDTVFLIAWPADVFRSFRSAGATERLITFLSTVLPFRFHWLVSSSLSPFPSPPTFIYPSHRCGLPKFVSVDQHVSAVPTTSRAMRPFNNVLLGKEKRLGLQILPHSQFLPGGHRSPTLNTHTSVGVLPAPYRSSCPPVTMLRNLDFCNLINNNVFFSCPCQSI